jgi:hypothetical protein
MDGESLAEFRMLNPVSKNAMYLGNCITLLACVAIVGAPTFFLRGTQWFPYALAISLAIVIALAAYLLLSPPIFYRHYRYRMDEDCIEIRKGVIIHSHILVPVERIHQVDVRRGPILRRYGLAGVTVTTAGGVVSIDYLEEEVAERIASNLNERIVAMLRARS